MVLSSIQGFRPAFVLFKNSSNSGENWIVYDHKRDTYNEAFRELFPNDSSAEYTATAFDIDIFRNGFKQRGANTGSNGLNRNIYLHGICRKSIRNINRCTSVCTIKIGEKYVGISRK